MGRPVISPMHRSGSFETRQYPYRSPDSGHDKHEHFICKTGTQMATKAPLGLRLFQIGLWLLVLGAVLYMVLPRFFQPASVTEAGAGSTRPHP